MIYVAQLKRLEIHKNPWSPLFVMFIPYDTVSEKVKRGFAWKVN
jgi:hypothetical protein